MSWINSSLAALMPVLPKWTVKPFAKPYVAGENLKTAISHVSLLNDQGFDTTLDILGEHIQTSEKGRHVRDRYCEVINALSQLKAQNTISLKLTHLGLDLDPAEAENNLMTIVNTAADHRMGLTIDMENSPFTNVTLDLYRKAVRRYKGVGTALQAYLHRSVEDLRQLDNPGLHLRICKGIYRESPEISYQRINEIQDNFVTLSKMLLSGKGYACLATHDLPLLNRLEAFIESEKIAKDRFEFQVLYGVPMGNRLEELKQKGYTVRIYVPFGEAWFDYAVRRLKENPKIISYVIGNWFKK